MCIIIQHKAILNTKNNDMKTPTLKCCICGKEIHGYGNDPYPVKDEGRCCTECNATIVIPERIKLFTNITFKL